MVKKMVLLSLLVAASLAIGERGPSGTAAAIAAADLPALMPLNPELIDAALARGERIELSRTEARFVQRGDRRVNELDSPTAAATVKALAEQEVRAIVLLVEFTAAPPGGPTDRFSPAVFDSMLFGESYVRGGADLTTDRTLRNYYHQVSYGSVDIVTLHLPGATGWVAAPNDYAYYCEADGTHDNGFGPYPRNVQRLVMDAVLAADPYVDFSQYASGGVVENLFVIHAGSGAEWNGGSTLIWSHAWSVASNDGWGTVPPALYVDGVQVRDYSMEPECGGDTTGESGSASGPFLPTVGVYAHEFGHVLGLPDEYDYGYESSGTGRFSLMAGGSWNRTPNVLECFGNSPAHPSAWGRSHLGFVTPVQVAGALIGAAIEPVESTATGSVYRLADPDGSGQEYWLVENRQQIGFDEGLVTVSNNAHGLLIYHVDEGVLSRTYWRPNEAECVSGGAYLGLDNCDCQGAPVASNNERWYGISVEQADGLYQLELGQGSGGWQDFFNETITGATVFDEQSVPNSSAYADCGAPVAVRGVTGDSGTMTADFFVGQGATPAPLPTAALDLRPNRPNPFNPATVLSFSLPEPAFVRLGVYAVDGRRVAELLAEPRSAGDHELTWYGRDDGGREVPSGVYFYRLEAGERVQTRRMTLLK